MDHHFKICADVAELADALDLGSSVYDVQVRFLSSAPKKASSLLGEGVFLCVEIRLENDRSRTLRRTRNGGEAIRIC